MLACDKPCKYSQAHLWDLQTCLPPAWTKLVLLLTLLRLETLDDLPAQLQHLDSSLGT